MLPPIASRFVAGESEAEALDHAHDLDERGLGTILNLLGEHYEDAASARADVERYLTLLSDLDSFDGRACISVKPSQLGLGAGEAVFREHLAEIAAAGADRGVFVWVDMEDHTTTDATIDAFEDLAREHDGGMGLCLQANLKRTPEDLARLADVPGKLRLVKGAYEEPPEIAYRDRARVDEAYRELITQAFEQREGGIAIGSHDGAMIDHALDCHAEHGADFEIQMLMGVREDYQQELAAEYEVWQYVPYGTKWLSYFYRRVMERKENLRFALRAVAGR